MTTRLLQLWRSGCAVLGFAATGLLALLFSFVVLPLDRRLRGADGSDLRAQRWVHRGCRMGLWIYRSLGLLRIRVHGADRLTGGPRLIVANHPTLFDFLLFSAVLPQVDCVVKPSWAGTFFLRGMVESADYLRWESPRRVLREGVRRLTRGRSLLIFPEGTRSPRGGLGPFHRGAAHVALAAGVPVVPVLVRCEPPILSKGQKWYDLGTHPVLVTLRVQDEIPSRSSAEAGMAPAEATRRLNEELREVFAKGLDLAHSGT
jgi:1-acyl-sn-glycerol-3-phosphate acyltransferase